MAHAPDPIALMTEAIQYAEAHNPIWPFSAMITDSEGNWLCQATDCAHISPLYHAESLALHVLIQNKEKLKDNRLTLVCTAEPDTFSLTTLHWAQVVHDLNIEAVYFGSAFSLIQSLWPFGIDIPSADVLKASACLNLTFTGAICEDECNALFRAAKQKQELIDQTHPSAGNLSCNVEDFFTLHL